MINIRSIRKLGNNDGLTLKMGKKVNYKSGWQVATEGIECKTAQEAIDAVRDYGGNCGVWFSEGVYERRGCRNSRGLIPRLFFLFFFEKTIDKPPLTCYN